MTTLPLDIGKGAPAGLVERLAALRAAGANRDASGLLNLAFETFPGRVAILSAFGAESAVLLHLAAAVDPTVPVLFLNTGKLFGETLRYRDRLQEQLGLTDIRAISPHPADRAAEDPDGDLWRRDADACCRLRKVMPLRRALLGFDALITGRKRFQTESRAHMEAVEAADGRIRFNPLANWTAEAVAAYAEAAKLPRHPLAEDGYPSIGCMPCTRRVEAGEGYRTGRWAGLEKDECGIHTNMDGDGI